MRGRINMADESGGWWSYIPIIGQVIDWIANTVTGDQKQKEQAQLVMNLLDEKYSDYMTPEQKTKLQSFRTQYYGTSLEKGKESEAQKGMLGTGLAEQRTIEPIKEAQSQEEYKTKLQEEMQKKTFQAGKEKELLAGLPTLSMENQAKALKKFKSEYGSPSFMTSEWLKNWTKDKNPMESAIALELIK